MSTAEIIAQLPSLSHEALSQIQSKLDELVGKSWLAGANPSDADKNLLEQALAEYEMDPDAVCSWQQAKSEILDGLKQ